jgi:hypothetical protein
MTVFDFIRGNPRLLGIGLALGLLVILDGVDQLNVFKLPQEFIYLLF